MLRLSQEDIMRITKIVITGGPCSGKTSSLKFLKDELSKRGYNAIIINESATEIMSNGIDTKACNSEIEFQKSVLSLQLLKEKFYDDVCKKLSYKDVVIICDRGLMDGKAYLSKNDYKLFLNQIGISEVELRDNYDAVFHLTTTANGKENFYGAETNSSRREKSVKEAEVSDAKTLAAWTGTPHLRIIGNQTNFDEKRNQLLNEILGFLGDPEPLEIERKFLIEKPNEKLLLSQPACEKVEIEQVYLKTKANETRRIRMRGLNGHYVYFLTTKKKITGMKRIEIEKRISKEEYENYLKEADPNLAVIKKSRYCLASNGKYFEIDIFPFVKNTAFLEIELLSEKEKFEIPKFIKVIKEVTYDSAFSNRSLAKSIPCEMK